jgi:hypothetical protein
VARREGDGTTRWERRTMSISILSGLLAVAKSPKVGTFTAAGTNCSCRHADVDPGFQPSAPPKHGAGNKITT